MPDLARSTIGLGTMSATAFLRTAFSVFPASFSQGGHDMLVSTIPLVNSGGSAKTPLAEVIFSTLTRMRFAPFSLMLVDMSLLRKPPRALDRKKQVSIEIRAPSPPESCHTSGSRRSAKSLKHLRQERR